MTTEQRTCFEMWDSSSLDTSASLRSKLLRCLCGFGDGEPENRLLGLDSLAVGDPDSQLLKILDRKDGFSGESKSILSSDDESESSKGSNACAASLIARM
uniref:Uncharacterized protein n=1 Tax=Oryza punctata TaxID=4537 RepID=A0A0E0ML55_ORYPU